MSANAKEIVVEDAEDAQPDAEARRGPNRDAEPASDRSAPQAFFGGRDPAARSTEAAHQRRAAPKEPASGDTLQIRGRKIHIRRYGDPEAKRVALAAHGWAAHGGRWASFGAPLGGEMGVIAPDLPGYGRSDPPPDDGNPIFAHDGAALAELAAATPSRLHLIGAGPGAEAAARIALRHPEKTASLILIEPAAFALLEEAQDPRRMEALDLALGVVSLASFGEKERAARLTADFWGGEGAFDALSEEDRAYATACADRATAEMQAISRHTPGALLFEDYAAIEAPMLVISGAKAPASVRACAARIRRAAPLARAVELPDAYAARAPLAVDAAAREFLRALFARSPHE